MLGNLVVRMNALGTVSEAQVPPLVHAQLGNSPDLSPKEPPEGPYMGDACLIVVPNVETLVSTREILRTVWGQNFRRTLEFSVNLWAHRINLLGLGG